MHGVALYLYWRYVYTPNTATEAVYRNTMTCTHSQTHITGHNETQHKVHVWRIGMYICTCKVSGQSVLVI